jgi:hypothetical protein
VCDETVEKSWIRSKLIKPLLYNKTLEKRNQSTDTAARRART